MLKCLTRISHLSKRGLANATKEKWDLYTSVCLERTPVITRSLNELEQKYHSFIREVEVEQSSKSDHEIRHENDLLYAEKIKGNIDIDLDIVIKETAQDFYDASRQDFKQFQFANRVTDADKKNDVTSLERKLDKHLVLLLKQNLGEKSIFLLPQALRQDGETLRQTAERVVADSCGPDVKVQFYGNAPAGIYKYRYPKPVQQQTDAVGAKVFFYLVRHRSGELNSKTSEFKWLDRSELQKELLPEYHKAVSQFLIDE